MNHNRYKQNFEERSVWLFKFIKYIVQDDYMIYILVVIIFLVLIIKDTAYQKEIDDEKYFSKIQTNCLKGICATYLLIHHICYDIKDLYIFFEPIKYMAFFIVGLFLFISGYGLMTNLLTKENYLDGWIKNKLPNLLFSYLVVTLFYIIIRFNIDGINIIYLILDVIFARTVGPLWFMTVFFGLNILFYFVFKKFRIKTGINIFLVISIAYMFILAILDVPSVWFSSIIGFWFGLFYKYNEENFLEKFKIKYWKKLFIVAMLFGILFIGRLIISYLGIDSELIHAPFRNIIVILFDCLILMLCLKLNFKQGIFNFLGNISYEIYLIHPFILLIYKDNLYMNSLNIIMVIVLSIIFAYILSTIRRKFFKKM